MQAPRAKLRARVLEHELDDLARSVREPLDRSAEMDFRFRGERCFRRRFSTESKLGKRERTFRFSDFRRDSVRRLVERYNDDPISRIIVI